MSCSYLLMPASSSSNIDDITILPSCTKGLLYFLLTVRFLVVSLVCLFVLVAFLLPPLPFLSVIFFQACYVVSCTLRALELSVYMQ